MIAFQQFFVVCIYSIIFSCYLFYCHFWQVKTFQTLIYFIVLAVNIVQVRTVMKLFPSAIMGLASTMAHAVEILTITLVLALTNGLDLAVD